MIQAKECNWKPIAGWEDYSVSDSGLVYSHRRNRLLKIWDVKGEYPRATLNKGNKKKSFTVHRLVASAFIENPLNKKTVNHKDGNKNNCHVSNLEWATMSENMIHAVNTGLFKVPYLGQGEIHPSAKLSNVDIEMIKVLVKHDFTMEQIAARFHVHQTHISSIKLNKTRILK